MHAWRNKMINRNLFLMLSMVWAVIVLFGCEKAPPFECTDSIGCVTIAPGEPVKIGVLQDLSGGAVSFGTDQLRCMELAAAEKGNQLLGHPMELIIEDSRCSPEGGAIAALKMVADPGVVAVLGTTCSRSAVNVSKIVSRNGLAMVSGHNTAASLTSVGDEPGSDWYPGFLRTIHNGTPLGYAGAIFAFKDLHVTRVATVDQGDPYTRGATEAFKQMFTDLGGEIVLSTTVNRGDKDMKPALNGVAHSGAQLLFFVAFRPEGDLIVKQAKQVSGFSDIILMGGGALVFESFIKSVGPDGLGMYFSHTAPPKGPAVNKLVAEYKSRYDEPPQTSTYAYAYDAADILFAAIENAAVKEPNGTLHIGRQALRDALYAISGFEGVSGILTCNKYGDCGSGGARILRLDDLSRGITGLMSNVKFIYRPGKKNVGGKK